MNFSYSMLTHMKNAILQYVGLFIKNDGSNEGVYINALLDSGADKTVLSSKVAEKLNLTGVQQSFRLIGSGGNSRFYDKGKVATVKVQSYNKKFIVKIKSLFQMICVRGWSCAK